MAYLRSAAEHDVVDLLSGEAVQHAQARAHAHGDAVAAAERDVAAIDDGLSSMSVSSPSHARLDGIVEALGTLLSGDEFQSSVCDWCRTHCEPFTHDLETAPDEGLPLVYMERFQEYTGMVEAALARALERVRVRTCASCAHTHTHTREDEDDARRPATAGCSCTFERVSVEEAASLLTSHADAVPWEVLDVLLSTADPREFFATMAAYRDEMTAGEAQAVPSAGMAPVVTALHASAPGPL